MKTFMEEYGKVIVVAIIIVALIGVALVFKTSGMESINGIWKNFMTKSQLGLEISDSETSGGGSSEQGGSETPSGLVVKTLSCSILELSDFNGIQYEEDMTWYEWFSSDYAVESGVAEKYNVIGHVLQVRDPEAPPNKVWWLACKNYNFASDYVKDGFVSK